MKNRNTKKIEPPTGDEGRKLNDALPGNTPDDTLPIDPKKLAKVLFTKTKQPAKKVIVFPRSKTGPTADAVRPEEARRGEEQLKMARLKAQLEDALKRSKSEAFDETGFERPGINGHKDSGRKNGGRKKVEPIRGSLKGDGGGKEPPAPPREPLLERLRKIMDVVETKLLAGDFKPTVTDWIRMAEMERQLVKTTGPRQVVVRWIMPDDPDLDGVFGPRRRGPEDGRDAA